MAVKKASKKASANKVVKKTATKVSSSNYSNSALHLRDTDYIFEGVEDDFGDDTKKVFIDGFQHYHQAKLKAENGEFRGDFTRDTFDPCNRFSKVLMQQGRVQLDADWNEQIFISLHHLRNLACDIGSEHWGPNKGAGFALNAVDNNDIGFFISPGHYYVDGILCEVGLSEEGKLISYMHQPDYPVPEDEQASALKSAVDSGEQAALVYLDVWERHYTYINDDSIREVALAGPDTATRAKVIWQIKVALIPVQNATWNGDGNHPFKDDYQLFLDEIISIKKPGTGRLCAKVKDKSGDENDPCLVAPESRYRGMENQLYRVEIHRSGVTGELADKTDQAVATFKWSRENSSVAFPITNIQGNAVSLEHLGKDCRYGLKPNDWVEIIDDDSILQCRADNLLQVESVDTENRVVNLKDAPASTFSFDESKHPYLRRWDHTEGGTNGVLLPETAEGQSWLELEDGILIKFDSDSDVSDTEDGAGNAIPINNIFRTGDYWLIPARVMTGDIEWPRDKDGKAKCIPPFGTVHHYAPLALFGKEPDNNEDGETANTVVDADLRRILKQAW